MWTMLQRKASKKWELVKDDMNSQRIVQTGYTASDMGIMSAIVQYMNHGIRGSLPDCMIDDLDYIQLVTP